MNLKNVYEGWKNVAFTDEQIETMAKERIKICKMCPNKIKMMKVAVCALCHCPLIAKTRSPNENCPINQWTVKDDTIS